MDRQVVEAVTKSVSSDIGTLKRGGEELDALLRGDQTACLTTLCAMLTADAGNVDPTVRLGAAIFLKNTLKRSWEHEEQLKTGSRELVRGHILHILVSSSQSVRNILYDVLEVIVATDFPQEWPELLPSIINQYYKPFLHKVHAATNAQGVDLTDILIASDIMLHIMSKYEKIERSTGTLAELKYILSVSQECILYTYEWFAQMYCAGTTDAQLHRKLCEGTCSSLKTIKALHGVDLPAFFEENLDRHMTRTLHILTVPQADDEMQSDLKITACELIKEYAQKYSEEFNPFTLNSTKALVQAIQLCSNSNLYDALVGSAMSTLAVISVVRWEPDQNPFLQIPNLCQDLCTSVILNHVTLREEDLEACEDEPLVYAREDLEGLLRGARREGAAQLIKALLAHHEAEVCTELLKAIKAMLTESQNSGRGQTERMLLREAATYLVTSISVKSSTRTKGITEVTSVVSISEYLHSQLMPILTDNSDLKSPEVALVKGSALKFVCMFRRFITAEELIQILPQVVKYLGSNNVYVYTNAASTLERLLTAKAPGEPFLDRQSTTVQTCLQQALQPLFAHVSLNTESLDNEYVMRCLWRLLPVVRMDVGVQAARLNDLVTLLREVARKPVNPIFCHYLFEAVAALSGIVAVAVGVSPQGLELHTYTLKVMTEIITEEESHAFVPYAYQVVSGLLSTMPTEVPAGANTMKWGELYVGIYDGVLEKERWTASNANLPGILSLVASFLRRPWILGKHMEQATGKMLTLFNYCLGNRRMTAKISFEFVNNIIYWMPENVLRVYARPLVACLSQYLAKVSQGGINIPTECAAVSMSALQIKCDLVASGGKLGRQEGDNRTPDLDVPTLIDNQTCRLAPYMNVILLPVAADVKSIPDRKCILAAFFSLMTHPLVRANMDLARKVKEMLPFLAGLIRKDEIVTARPVRAEDPTDEMRERLFNSMATEEEKGVADLSGAYNKLATTTLTSQEHPLSLLIPDAMLRELMK